MLKPEEIERRVPVWTALSELFLDTQFDDATCRHVAEQLRGCGYSLGEVEQILRDEVAPAFFPNLLVAGEWAGWTADQVRDIVLSHLKQEARVPRLAAGLLRRWHQWKMKPIIRDWASVKALLTQ
jgi:hypothetical protein